jgi:hypothetical protein
MPLAWLQCSSRKTNNPSPDTPDTPGQPDTLGQPETLGQLDHRRMQKKVDITSA